MRRFFHADYADYADYAEINRFLYFFLRDLRNLREFSLLFTDRLPICVMGQRKVGKRLGAVWG